MILIVSIGAKATFFVVTVVSRNALIGMYSLYGVYFLPNG